MTSKFDSSRNFLSKNSIEGLIKVSLNAQSYRFGRQVCQKWLETYPNDLSIQYLLAKAFLGEGNHSKAGEILFDLTQKDPEFANAFELSAYISKDKSRDTYIDSLACVRGLGRNITPDIGLPGWAEQLYSARAALYTGSLEKAESIILKVVGLNLNLPLPSIYHLQIVEKHLDDISTLQLARIYHMRWPKCLQFKLILAKALMKFQDEKGSLSYLKDCVQNDIGGQVAQRLWGNMHQFTPLWPEDLRINFQDQIPAEVSALLGWNILNHSSDHNKKDSWKFQAHERQLEEELIKSKGIINEGRFEEITLENDPGLIAQAASLDHSNTLHEKFTQESFDEAIATAESIEVTSESQGTPNVIFNAENKKTLNRPLNEDLKSVKQVFEKLAKKFNVPNLGKSDSRFPMCILMSTKIGLKKQFGEQTTTVIEKEMRQLADELRKRPGWGASVFFPDVKESIQGLGIQPIDQNDPFQIKQSLVNLDQALSKKGEKIGALIIIGGPDIVPYFKLANPTDDADNYVFSDNPYATTDSNNFVHNWPVGRISSQTGSEPGLLILQLRNVIGYHKSIKRGVSWWNKIELTESFSQLFGLIGDTILRKNRYATSLSFGYTASVWKDSSKAVYRVIGDPEKILISPPAQSGEINQNSVLSPLGYYNLHGLEDTSNWYGQRDLVDTIPGPDYPVALTPEEIVNNGKHPKVVFSEACYGGHILNKKESDSIALKFLSIGTPVFIGSTGISYGSVTSPLIGADFLAYLFWYHFTSGYTAGEALLQARIDFVREMHTRQGFLDGEDQKTLLSFVLFGDPMTRMDERQEIKKFVPRNLTEEPINTICDVCSNQAEEAGITKEIMNEIKQIVEMYIPGMDEAEISIANQHKVHQAEVIVNEKGEKVEMKSAKKEPTGKLIVSFKKQIKSVQQVHKHYAKATLDSNGKMIKLALSK